ncbi:MAG: SUMF1/EgtB/PvdO family nonheme iron enzyme [bacterium]|nr:SUMF1/EgtB/PvdO family nonheme iron enzyme [bacterium]
MMRLYPIPLWALIALNLFCAVTHADEVESATAEAAAPPSIQRLESVIRQQQQTIRMLKDVITQQKQAIADLQKQATEQNQFIQAAKESFQKTLDELRSGVETIRKQLTENESSGQDTAKRIETMLLDQQKASDELQTTIVQIKKKIARDFESLELDGMTFVKIPAGSFRMGTSENEIAMLKEHNAWSDLYTCETPVHDVTLARPFLIAAREISQDQWRKVMGGRNPASFKGGDLPIESITWYEAKRFIEKLNEQSHGGYRLPTEAEWEYCARADGGLWDSAADGTTLTSGDLDSFAWSSANSKGMTHPIGQKKPNAWGLYDMLGNVWEWCEDWYHVDAYTILDPTNPFARQSSAERVIRGGCVSLPPESIRVTFRGGQTPGNRSQFIGLRLACDVEN